MTLTRTDMVKDGLLTVKWDLFIESYEDDNDE